MQIRKKDYSWSYFGTILEVAVGAIILPFVLAFLSDDELGLWYVFASISNLVILLDFGFTATIARNIAYSWSGASNLSAAGINDIEVSSEKNADLFASTLKTSKLIYLIISLIALIIMMLPGSYYVHLVADNDQIQHVLLSWIIYAFAVFLNLYYGYVSAYLRGVGAVAENSKAISISKLVQLPLTVILLMLGFGILGTSIAYLISCIVFRIILLNYFKHFDGVSELLKNATTSNSFKKSISLIKTIWHNAWRDGLVSLAMFMSTQANTLICSYVLGLNATGFYGFATQIATIITAIGSAWYTTIQPKLQEYAVKRKYAEATSRFSLSIVIYLILCISLSVLAAIVCPYLLILIKSQLSFDFIMFVAISIYMIIYRGNVLFVSCISNFNTIPYTKAYLITGLLSVGLSFVLAALTDLGLWSLILSPLLFTLLYNAWKWPSVVFHKLHVSLLEFIRVGNKELWLLSKKMLNKIR